MAADDKKTTTIRLDGVVMSQLQHASHVLGRSQSQIVEEALRDYIQKHNLQKRYVVLVEGDYTVLLSVDGADLEAVEVRQRNGVPLSDVAERYSAQLRVPVSVAIRKERTS